MNIVTTIDAWQSIRKTLTGKSTGFVPTMGNLHQGHLSLCERAQKENDMVVVSIFVNPTQFNQPNDLLHYPRTLAEDRQKLEKLKVDFLFMPETKAMYPDDYEVRISETKISKELEGEYRPGHFDGMLTVVLKLLNLMQADRAYFGEKDFQQLLLVKKMAAALFLPTEIIACETIRADDGLALSSRNSRLSMDQRQKAGYFSALMKSGLQHEEIKNYLQQSGMRVDYISEKWGRRLGAVWIDDIRLIDNISLQEG